MDVLPSGNLFRELQDVTDTGYFEWKLSLEDYWQQVSSAATARRAPPARAPECRPATDPALLFNNFESPMWGAVALA